jgi:hypothetical protein
MDANSMQTQGTASDVQNSHVLDGRILADLNRASRQHFDLIDSSLGAVS